VAFGEESLPWAGLVQS